MDRLKYIVLYDADCGFCKLVVRWLLRLDRKRCLRPVSIQGAEGQDLLSHLPEAKRIESAHLLSPDGTLSSGGAAAAPLAELLPGGSIAARLFSRFPAQTDHAYRWVARHRVFFGRLGIRTDSPPDRPDAASS
ncbi:MAG: DCC1-like thiol-disulfide oxidoreductase family protein [Thermoleophilaceae bacterium]